ncbi:MAG: FkbM family methyltransferase [Neisseria sp.]|nr:FkbM family methyltransferase [Neisseria sp.]
MKTHLKALRHGLFNLIEGDMISSVAAYTGEWSDVEVALFQILLNADANVVEVGSNIGLHAVPLAKAVPQGKLICFEPQRVIFQQLCCNLALNNITNAYAYQAGVGGENGIIRIESGDYSEEWNYGCFSLDKGFSTEQAFQGRIRHEEVEVVALDSFKPVQQLNRLDLLKIDAEGYDIPVLQGARETIARFRPAIFIEIQTETFADTLSAVHDLGYQAYWFLNNRWQPDNFYGAPEKNFGADGNLICFPKEAEIPIGGLLEAVEIDQLERGEVQLVVKLYN